MSIRWLFFVLAAGTIFSWVVLTTGVDTNLRGISRLDDKYGGGSAGWASGSNATLLRTENFGQDWKRITIPNSEGLDFRGVQAVSARTTYVMSSGEGDKSRIYKTSDSGKTWELQYQGKRKEFFLDALACADATHCYALSDPVDGKFVILRTQDGKHWNELPGDGMPPTLEKEGAFAASNSCLMVYEGRELYFVTGGPAARVFHSMDLGKSWTVAEAPVMSGKASAGIFSLARFGKTVVAVGGDYQDQKDGQKAAAVSFDEGKTWQAVTDGLDQYRSAVAVNFKGEFVAVGPTGSEISQDGLHWKKIDSGNWNAVTALSEGMFWVSGPKGTVARLARIEFGVHKQK